MFLLHKRELVCSRYKKKLCIKIQGGYFFSYFYSKLSCEIQVNKHLLQQHEHFGVLELPVVKRGRFKVLPRFFIDVHQAFFLTTTTKKRMF